MQLIKWLYCWVYCIRWWARTLVTSFSFSKCFKFLCKKFYSIRRLIFSLLNCFQALCTVAFPCKIALKSCVFLLIWFIPVHKVFSFFLLHDCILLPWMSDSFEMSCQTIFLMSCQILIGMSCQTIFLMSCEGLF